MAEQLKIIMWFDVLFTSKHGQTRNFISLLRHGF